MAEQKVGEILARLSFMQESDVLDFAKTGRAVLVVEDNQANLPLPAGPAGPQGPKGEPGSALRADLVLDEETDSVALEKLNTRSRAWSREDVRFQGYFAINKPTKSGFMFTRGGWVVIRDIFGSSTELIPAETTLPIIFDSVTVEPSAPEDGKVALFAQDGKLMVKFSNGTTKVLSEG